MRKCGVEVIRKRFHSDGRAAQSEVEHHVPDADAAGGTRTTSLKDTWEGILWTQRNHHSDSIRTPRGYALRMTGVRACAPVRVRALLFRIRGRGMEYS